MKTVTRFDYVSALKQPERLDNGFIRVEGLVARIGIQEYRDSSGGIRRELRLPEEVFDDESLASFSLLPLTNTHPPAMLTADTAKQFTVGSVGQLERQGDYVKAEILVHDAAAIKAIENGRVQLSNGYICELDERQDESLTTKYGRYDFVQRRIRGNHIAVVDNARAGEKARLRLDEAEVVETGEFLEAPTSVLSSVNQRSTREKEMPHKFKLDGFEISVDDPNMETIIVRSRQVALDAADKEKTRADAAVKALTEGDATRAELTKSLSETQAKLDAQLAKVREDADKMVECKECEGTGKVDGEKCDNCGGEGEYAAKTDSVDKQDSSRARMIHRAAATRAALIVEAQKHLGANEKLDASVDNVEIKRRVIVKLDKSLKMDKGVLRGPDGKDRTDDLHYIDARFDIAIEDVAKTNVRPIDAARAAATQAPGRVDNLPTTDANAARLAMIARAQSANVKNGKGQ